jgi:hypothetical protein
VTGRVPVLPRSNHSATVFGDDLNSIFFFGGTSLHSFLDDSLVLTGIGSGMRVWVSWTRIVANIFIIIPLSSNTQNTILVVERNIDAVSKHKCGKQYLSIPLYCRALYSL